MASRTSSKVPPGRGALIYQNNSAGAQLVALHGCSNSASANVPITVILDTSNTRPLNGEQAKWGTVGGNIIDIDIRNSGADTISNVQNNAGILGTGNSPFNTGTSNAHKLYQNYDPYMRLKPSDYGNASDDVCSMVFMYNSRMRLLQNTVSMGSGDWTNILSANYTTHDQQHNPNYIEAGVVFDHYTNSFFGTNNNSYTEWGLFCPGNTSVSSGTRSSDSQVYSGMGSSYDPRSYPTQGSYGDSFKSPMLQAEGGVFVTYLNPPGSGDDLLIINPASRAVHDGTLPSDKATVSTGDLSSAGNTQIDNSWTYHSKFAVTANAFQWFKYNKNNDTYYFAFGGVNSGIWQMKYETMTYNNNNHGGLGGGPQGNQYHTFSGGSWSKVGTMPSGQMSIPARVGQSLWVSYRLGSGEALFSTNLYEWSEKATHFAANGIDTKFSAAFEDATQSSYLLTSAGNVVQISSGLELMPQDGLLEKESPIGAYERSGLILSPGDCIYAGNGGVNAVSFTVTEVAI